ncbi:Peptidase S41 [Trichormus variabilis ATCC 29413]|uniref:Peptidase S41 n=2 Tax=Anabaena variabilis TaxID=264691 RepID=Q3MEZ8_TRIV2|nr:MULTISPECIES: S41 family peptidase [Nostocaceae]ABA20438.1 Peptidase S41 [Trichormus variabilis ATCC 29413]MBC1217100.1 S41 family peptidase [Trichormus variabilis ARAD]MBC1256681.1 S41 family peptidase [Trichormus variabilis V5]MBC1269112.1 S41 family peptidase [Trichormus variabilis FSR]MBC1304491.1 S41 family peptidase [Trichormus variabilis N2B]
MKKSLFLLFKRLLLALSLSIFILPTIWVNSPVLPLLAKPETRIFEQVWQTVNDNFYDPKMNGVNWQITKEKYKPEVLQAKSDQEVAAIFNQMLSELKTSHTRYYTQDDLAYYQLLGIFYGQGMELPKELKKFFPNGKFEYSGIGLFTKEINGKTFVSSILDESPADKDGLKVGDQVISVDGNQYYPIRSFVGKAGQTVKILIQRSPQLNSRQEITIVPKMFDASTMFLEAQMASIEILKQENKKIGYVHIWSNAADPYQQQLQNELIYGRLKNADGLILDLRDGWGGGDISYLNIFTAEKSPSVTHVQRNGRRYTYNYQWKKPVVMLVNEGSRSSKEILAFNFQQNQIGQVIGTKTTGAVVAGRPYIMQDGSLVYVAVADVFLNGNQRLEGKGVTPDINVPFSLEYAQGVDPQKQKAIETLLKAL